MSFSERPTIERRHVVRRPVRRRSRNDEGPQFILGLDFGFSRDYTALALLERVAFNDTDGIDEGGTVRNRAQYLVRHLKRFRLRTEAPEIIAHVANTMQKRRLAGRTGLIVDGTGAGLPIVQEMRRRGLMPVAITITGGA